MFEAIREALGIEARALAPARLKELAGELQAFYGRSVQELLEGEIRALRRMDAELQAGVRRAASEVDLTRYYATTTRYIFGNLYLEGSRERAVEYRLLARACRRFGVRRALDFGGGAGGLCLYLWSAGIRCDYLDVAGPTSTFASFRFRRHGISPRTYDTAEAVPAQFYDAVFARDVFEHLWDVENAIRAIAAWLRAGGMLLSHSTFSHDGQDDHLEHNTPYADLGRWNALLAGHELDDAGQLKASRLSRWLRAIGLRDAVVGVRVSRRAKHGGNFLLHRKRAARHERRAA